MALLTGFPVIQISKYPVRGHGSYLRWTSMARRRPEERRGLEAGGSFCSMPNEDHPKVNVAINQSRAPLNSTSFDYVLDKSLNGQSFMQPATHHDLQFLPALEVGIQVADKAAPLLYKPYMDHLCLTLSAKAPNFRSLDLEPDFRRQASKLSSGSRVINWLSSASRLRRIRMTYFDGGSALQAFNSLLYPDFRYDVPMLGIDLLSFGANKILCVVDFTPLTQDPAYLEKYTSQLAPFRAKIVDHCGRMTTKFYDENQFFSKQLIFYRSEMGAKEPLLEVPNGLFFSTYVDYVDNYLQVLYSAEANEVPQHMSYVASRQNAYNRHSEERDPAIKIFNKHFGNEWSARFTRDFLFQQTPLNEEMCIGVTDGRNLHCE